MDVFGFDVPESCPDVDSKVLMPINAWENKDEYKKVLNKLAEKFIKNFKRYAKETPEEVIKAGPIL